MAFMNVNGQTIHYVDHGGSGPAIILSHGFSMDHEMWVGQIGPLVSAGWRVVTYDERGWGQTSSFGEFTYWDLAEDLLSLMDFLDIREAVLGGMSQGGFLSMRLALLNPERVRALVLIDTEGSALDIEEKTLFRGLYESARENGVAGPVGETLAAILFAPEFHGINFWRGKWNAKNPEEWNDADECLFERDDIDERLGEIKCPALVLHGDLDAAIPLERGKKMASLLGGETLFHKVNGAGHSANLEKPEIVNPLLLDFLANL
ncbi:MAG TPA: alpha/beta hydrolase [Acidimicrobiales bacterium]|nr:alpha/beta hydrolase [Acidimicrobiales bacterium]